MLVSPSVRKDLLITPWSYPYNNTITTDDLDQFSQLQDDRLAPDLLHDSQQSLFHEQHSLESPFQSPSRIHYSSRPSSGSASPVFSSPATAVSSEFPSVLDGASHEAPSMSVASSYNPSIHIQHSTPSPYPTAQFPPQQYQDNSPMLAQHGIATNGHGWNNSDSNNIQLLSPARAQNGVLRRSGGHKRAPSGSSGKTGSNSPHASVSNQPNSSSYSPAGNVKGFADNYQSSTKSLPTPVRTPIQNYFLAPAFQNYDPYGDNATAERAMRQAIMEQQSGPEDETSFHYSLAPSVSSLSHHNSPVTPQTTTYDEFDDGSKAVVHGEDTSPDFDRWMDEYLQFDAHPDLNGLPKLNRTISDIYQDELYSTPAVAAPHGRQQNANQQQQLLSAPYRSIFADRIHAANQGHLSARSQSPVNNQMSRERSPFRQGSPMGVDFRTARLQGSGFASTMQMPHTNGMDMGNAHQDMQGEPKTISPKDAVLEYHEGPEDAAMPSLFPSSSQTGSDLTMKHGDQLALRRPSASAFQPTQPYSQMESFPSQYATQAAGLQQPFDFMPQPQNPRRAANGLIPQTTLDFPASLPTMESTASDATPAQTEMQRPDDTSSDSGTYTCTYHGCTLRFETPSKLQKHKREAHRQTMPGQQPTVREHSTSLAMRNTQAGPHKCERINPSTGKACNSIFSRPYDLTRHEDTIHNARKQKVRCHLCTEEKTFSRNDALTRHMRVVHPEVDWPGKQRRKGRE
jgi:hypothetical protein